MSESEAEILLSLNGIVNRDTSKEYGDTTKGTFNDAEKEVAQKAMVYIEENWEDIEAKEREKSKSIGWSYEEGSCVCFNVHYVLQVLGENPDIAERAFAFAQRYNADFLYLEIVRQNPKNAKIAYEILKERFSGSFLNSVDNAKWNDDRKTRYELLSAIIENNSNNEKIAHLALESIEKTIQAKQESLKYWDNEDMEYRKPLSRDSFFSYSPIYCPAYDPRTHMIKLAAHNIKFPELVEHCLELSADYPNYLQDSLYNSLLSAGYKENDFEDRYAQRLNNKEFDFQQYRVDTYSLGIPFTDIANISDKLDIEVLCSVTGEAQRIIDYQKAEANNYHREPYLTSVDYENVNILAKEVDKRIKKEKIAKAQAQKNPPAVIFIEEFVGDTYGDWAERAYIRDEKGEYVETDVVDELHFNGESARDQLGNLVAAGDAIYNLDEGSSGYKLLEAKEGYKYRVLSDNAYWRDENTSALYHRGANEGSVLVSKNPVTGKFEDVPYENIERDHGDFVEGCKKSDDGRWKKVIYKRNDQDGKFYPEVEFPYGECTSCFQNDEKNLSITFLAENGDEYHYEANENGSVLSKQVESGVEPEIIYSSDSLIQHKVDVLREKLGQTVADDAKEATVAKIEKHKAEVRKNSANEKRAAEKKRPDTERD